MLVGGAALALTAACGRGDDDASPGSSRLDLAAGDGRVLLANFAYGGNYLVAETAQRMTFLVGQGGAPTTDVPPELAFQVSRDDRSIGDPIVVPAHRDGVPVPYFPLVTTFDEPGIYRVEVELDGEPATQAVQVSEPGSVSLPQVGRPLPAFETPTVADARGVDPICTDDPQCPFHGETLTAALASGAPVALLVGTPAYCRTGLCGPVLDLLEEAAPGRPGIRFVHAEVYADPRAVGDVSQATLAPIIDAYGLTFEPSLFVADATGRIVSRLDNVYDRVELGDALALVG